MTPNNRPCATCKHFQDRTRYCGGYGMPTHAARTLIALCGPAGVDYARRWTIPIPGRTARILALLTIFMLLVIFALDGAAP